MTGQTNSGWHFNRQINLGILVQLVLLASLIIGSWMNLQRQLDLLSHDLAILIESQNRLQGRIEELTSRSLSYEYRLRSLEKAIPQSDISKMAGQF